ncbi:MAG TPA: prepilin peptidase [Sporichthyaceae bacterium]|jgi:leader peptidase (prepilin peptidase)/N-methyltransferase|nr:prepilin peptidase [Sporichthyaceae bacterium]
MTVALGVLGLLIGSFLNVVVHRVPRGISVVGGRSACPRCAATIRPRDNVPVISWLLLGGKCRDCAVPISIRYPLVELATGGLFAVLGMRFGLDPVLPALLVLAAAGVALTLIDLDTGRLPFAITVPTLGAVAGLLVVAGSVRGWSSSGVALLSVGVWCAVYGGLWLGTAGRGMGLGDVVLAPSLGLVLGWLGWGPSLIGLLAGFGVGALVGVALIAAGRAQRRSAVPFGPFMLAGAAFGIFAGSDLWSAYLRVVGV